MDASEVCLKVRKFKSLARVQPNDDGPWTQRWVRRGVWEVGRVKRSIAGLPDKAKEQTQYRHGKRHQEGRLCELVFLELGY